MPGNDYVEKLLTQILGKLDRMLKVLEPEDHGPSAMVEDSLRDNMFVDDSELWENTEPPTAPAYSDEKGLHVPDKEK